MDTSQFYKTKTGFGQSHKISISAFGLEVFRHKKRTLNKRYQKNTMKVFKHCIFFIFTILLSNLSAQAQEQPLPKELTKGERKILNEVQFTSNKMTPPPDGQVRTAAEWEEIEYLVIRWTWGYQNIQRQIVEAAIAECKVLIATDNPGNVQSYLSSNDVDLTNIEFINEPTNSIWIRDYAGNTIYNDDVGERGMVDWIYNRPRPDDDVLPEAHANYLSIPFYATTSGNNDLVNTGGNFMSDGMGNAFASELILEENEPGNPYGVTPKTEAEIDAIMNDYMGITNFIKMNTLPYDNIHHIDMHMKLLDEETILVSKYPDGVADGPYIEDNIDYVTSNFESVFGDDYRIEWIDAPPSSGGHYPDNGGAYRTYTNSVFINKTVIVPTYRPEVDDDALALYEELLPGYNIVEIDVDNPDEFLIAMSGAIHCITHSIGVENPLLIVHQPIRESNTTENIAIEALIKHNSGIQDATVFYRVSGESDYEESPMTFTEDDFWETTISTPQTTEEIEYYIHAEANSGKTMTRPIVAPEGFWTIEITNLSTEEWARQNIAGPYPNPAKEEVHFRMNNLQGEVNVKVHSILGQQLSSTTLYNPDGKITLNLNAEWKGTLFITFEGNFGKVTKKLLKF